MKEPGDNSWMGEALVWVALIAAVVTLVVTGHGDWLLGIIVVVVIFLGLT